MQLYEYNLSELSGLVHDSRVKPSEILKSFHSRFKAVEDSVHAFLWDGFEEAEQEAAAMDRSAHKPGRSALWGIPYALKDNISTKGIRTSCASKILENYIPPYSAFVYEKLKAAGGILTGKTDMDEFAMGSTSESSALGDVRNPWDPDRVAGGSSGGSAAAVAARMTPFALGSDTGGSIRNPASFCGVTGFKPTYGTVSRYGLIAYASSLDQIGCLTRTAEDARIVMAAISGHDPADTTSIKAVPGYAGFSESSNLAGIRVGVLSGDALAGGLDEDVQEVYLQTIETMRSLGASIVDVSFAYMDYVIPTYYLIACSEASSNLARFDGIRYGVRVTGTDSAATVLASRNAGFGKEVKQRIMLGTYALSAGYYDKYYSQALKVRRLIKNDFENALTKADVILWPTTTSAAFRVKETENDPLRLYLSDIFTVTANLCGVPAMSIPAGFTKDSFPVGMQLLAGALKEETLFSAARLFQKETDWHKACPSL